MVALDASGKSSSVSIIKLCSGMHLTVCTSILIFGIGVPPIWQGVVGIATALEGYFGILQGDLRRVGIFLAGLVVNAVVGLTIGVTKLEEELDTCAPELEGRVVRKELNFTIYFDGVIPHCRFSLEMYAYAQLGTAIMSAVLTFLVSVSLVSLRSNAAQPRDPERFLLSGRNYGS